MPDSKDNQDTQWQLDAVAKTFTTYTVHPSAHVATKDITTLAEALAHSLGHVRTIEDEFLGRELCAWVSRLMRTT